MASILRKKAVNMQSFRQLEERTDSMPSIISFGLKFANWAAEMAKHIEEWKKSRNENLDLQDPGSSWYRISNGAKSPLRSKRGLQRA